MNMRRRIFFRCINRLVIRMILNIRMFLHIRVIFPRGDILYQVMRSGDISYRGDFPNKGDISHWGDVKYRGDISYQGCHAGGS